MGIISFAKRGYVFTPKEIKEKKIKVRISWIFVNVWYSNKKGILSSRCKGHFSIFKTIVDQFQIGKSFFQIGEFKNSKVKNFLTFLHCVWILIIIDTLFCWSQNETTLKFFWNWLVQTNLSFYINWNWLSTNFSSSLCLSPVPVFTATRKTWRRNVLG